MVASDDGESPAGVREHLGDCGGLHVRVILEHDHTLADGVDALDALP